jgi:hypothetical protein
VLTTGGTYQWSFVIDRKSRTPLNRNQPNLPEMFTGWSSTRFVFSLAEILKIFLSEAYQKQELPVVAMFVNGSGRNEKSL